MPTTQPFIRIEFAEREVVRLEKTWTAGSDSTKNWLPIAGFGRTWPRRPIACFSKSRERIRRSKRWPSHAIRSLDMSFT